MESGLRHEAFPADNATNEYMTVIGHAAGGQ